MASGTIKATNHYICKRRTLSISQSGSGFMIVGLGDGHGVQDITPAGYNYLSSRTANGSNVGIRNHVVFVGLTSNYSNAVFYTDATVDGTIDVLHWFVKTANRTEETG